MSVERGAEPVARITALPFQEALLIGALRARAAGPEAQRQFSTELADLMGASRAAEAEAALDGFLEVTLRHARRPLMRHGLTCACVGADEAVLAHLMTISTSGEREDAMLMACLLVRPDMAPAVVSQARTLGFVLLRGAPVGTHAAPGGTSATLH
ncbi:hypothetical protein [Oceanicola sp. S124]|uniref:hypothetical protein n=1 Tax=Oceanicola sp. S124 TaxID=1042378 RepID=UPI0002557AAD|nr:hypothetical protein [Oceanicola sp. S124]